MEQYNQKILSALTQYLLDNPSIRFGQALMNLGINEISPMTEKFQSNYYLRDIYNDSNNEIYERIKINQLKNK